MVFEEWAAFQTGLLMTIIFSIIIIVYFKLRERVSKLEKYLKTFKKDDEESDDEQPKEI